MGTSYNHFTDAFLNKVTEYDFIKLAEEDRTSIVDGYMKRACAEFNSICLYDLTDINDELREFNEEIKTEDIEEIIDIVSEGMLVQWFKPYFYRADNMHNCLNTPDYYAYSPAELLYRITNAYNQSKRDFINMQNDYSYKHGDLTKLHL